MIFLLVLAAGVVCGVLAALVGRFWGTILQTLPIADWFVVLLVMLRGGISDQESRTLGFGILGVLIALGLSEVVVPVIRRRLAATSNGRR